MPYKIATTAAVQHGAKGCAMPYKLQPHLKGPMFSLDFGDKGCAMPYKLQLRLRGNMVTKAVQCLSKLQQKSPVRVVLTEQGRKGCAMPLKLQQQNMVVRHLGSRRATKAVQCLTKLQHR